MTIRTAIYSRHSTELQNPGSYRDQVRECEKLVSTLGGFLVGVYQDKGLSGYQRDRPGLNRLLHDISCNKLDLLVAESIERIARDPENLHQIRKQLQFHGVALLTKSEGRLTT